MLTIIIWVYLISLVINEYDTLTKYKQEYYYYYWVNQEEEMNMNTRIKKYLGVVIKGTLILPFLAVIVLIS